MKSIIKRVSMGALLGFALLQLTNPARTNPPVERDFIATIHPPTDVAMTLRGACYDCHSHETRWPWYAHIAPASWLIASDIGHARRRLNLSAWPGETAAASRDLHAMSDELAVGEMPPRQYTLMHASARLTKDERTRLASWLASQATRLGEADARTTISKTDSLEPPASAAGRTLFLKNCAHCHSADARGDEGPDLHNLDWTDEQITQRILNGKKGQMTAFAGKFQTAEIQNIISYLRTLK